MVLTALFAAVICVLGPIAVPIGTISITLQIFAILLTVYIIGPFRGTISLIIYLILGSVGIPVFSGYSSGFACLTGPTGGYLVGFIFTAVISGIFFRAFPVIGEMSRNRRIINIVLEFIGMVLGILVCYAFGTVWFCIQASYSVGAALAVCVFPFIPFDLMKSAAVLIAGPQILRALKKAKLV